ncbi:MAG: hypothetical protein LBG48_04525 [Rickettsiales bacterium]|nr:hypothetical protein [Rickettsiales bacterium]
MKAKVVMFLVSTFFLLANSQNIYASNAANQLITEGEKVKTEIIQFVSDGFSKIVAPILTVIAVVYGLVKIVSIFIHYKRNQEIEIMEIIMSVAAIVVAGVLATISISSFIS